MLDADYVFERLLREAANLVSKMSTPKLTIALKGASNLQQKITDTLATRLQEENLDSQCEDTIRAQLSDDMNLQPILSNISSVLVDLPLVAHGGTQELLNDSSRLSVNIMNQSADCIVNEESSITTFPSCTVLSSLPGMTMVPNNNNTELGACNAILMPIMQSIPNTSMYQSVTTTSRPMSAHLTSAVEDPVTMNDHPVLSVPTIGYLDTATIPVSTPTPMNTLGCNGQNHLTLPELNGPLQGTELSVDMKPEPMDCIPRTSFESSFQSSDSTIISECPGLVSLPLSQLQTIGQFPSNRVTTSLPNNPSFPVSITECSSTSLSNTTSFVTVSAANSTPNPAKIVHGPGPYRCHDCDKEFRILRYLEKHRRIHTGEKPYQCCYCGRQFNDWPNMNRHKRIHTGERPYRCAVCAKTFSQPAVYNEHVKRHTGERPYICVVCAKGFPRAARLAVHMRVHTGERPYPCTSCDRRFSQPHHLAAHLRVHSGDRPYPCPKCEISFACISNLRRHRKQVHPSSPGPVVEDTEMNQNIVNFHDKKPSAHCLTIVSSHDPISASTHSASESALHVSPPVLGTDTSAALAAAMSGAFMTATGALVPANLLPASSLPGLFLTSTPHGTILAAPSQFADQQNQLQQMAHSSISCAASDAGLTKSVSSSSSTLSLMLPTMLTTNQRPDSLRQTAVTFLAPTGEPDRSCTGGGLSGATLMSTGQEGSIVLNSASGETVYWEPLDTRLAFESGQPFTLATIPTSNSHTATILGQSPSGTQIFGHPIQLQPGSHIAFATSIHGHPSQLLAPSSSVISTSQAYTGQGPTILVQQPNVLSSSSNLHMNPPTQASTPTQILHYPRSTSNSNVPISPGRPSSTPVHQQQQPTVFVPVMNSVVSSASTASPTNPTTITISNAAGGLSHADWSTGFTTLVATSVSPAAVDENVESVTFTTSRPSSVLSASSLNAATAVGAITDNII